MNHDSSDPRKSLLAHVLLIAAPLILLAIVLVTFSRVNPLSELTGGQPPVEELNVDRVVLDDDGFLLYVTNSGLSEVTIAQVMIDEAYWAFSVDPDAVLNRLESVRIQVPYPWVEGEAHEIVLLTSSGATFGHVIEVAIASPVPDARRWILLGMIGFLVGIVPVGLGLMWFPLLRKLSAESMQFVLSMTVGLLVFLFFDTLSEAFDFAEAVPDVYKAIPLLFVAALMSYGGLMAIGSSGGFRDRTTKEGRYWIALAMAIGIGVHNLGEGLAVGTSIATGEIALGSFLIVGFILHNVTEGVGIGAPMAQDDAGFPRLLFLTIVAGAPAIAGTWLGGFMFTPIMAVVFLAIGAGAILQVIVEVGRLVLPESGSKSEKAARFSGINFLGVATGIGIMYATALLI